MESGPRFERYPGFESEESKFKPEDLGEFDEMDEEFGINFEAPRHLNDEDAKELRYAGQNEKADTLQSEINNLSESIQSSTQQLAALPLTPEQGAMLDKILALMDERNRISKDQEKDKIDKQIEQTTRDLADLPFTPEQAGLLDHILEMIDARDQLEFSLQELAANSSK